MNAIGYLPDRLLLFKFNLPDRTHPKKLRKNSKSTKHLNLLQIKLSINRRYCHVCLWCTSTYYKFTRYKSAINVMNRNNTISISFVILVLPKLNIASIIIIIIGFAVKPGFRVWRRLVPFDKSQLMRFRTSWKINCMCKVKLNFTWKRIDRFIILYKLCQYV